MLLEAGYVVIFPFMDCVVQPKEKTGTAVTRASGVCIQQTSILINFRLGVIRGTHPLQGLKAGCSPHQGLKTTLIKVRASAGNLGLQL